MMTIPCDHHYKRGLSSPFWDNFPAVGKNRSFYIPAGIALRSLASAEATLSRWL